MKLIQVLVIDIREKTYDKRSKHLKILPINSRNIDI
jgi:hypothetical protein